MHPLTCNAAWAGSLEAALFWTTGRLDDRGSEDSRKFRNEVKFEEEDFRKRDWLIKALLGDDDVDTKFTCKVRMKKGSVHVVDRSELLKFWWDIRFTRVAKEAAIVGLEVLLENLRCRLER